MSAAGTGRFMAAAAALALATLPMPASAENWKSVTTMEAVAFAIDLDSIRTEGGLRHFRLRTLFTDGRTAVGYFDAAADCAGKTVDTLHAEIWDQGKKLTGQDFTPGVRRNSLEDAQGRLVYPIVCAG